MARIKHPYGMPMDQSCTLGVDGGGTRCRVRLRDAAGRLLGEAEGGLANVYQDFEGALRSIVETARAACAAARLGEEATRECRAGLGLAGVTDSARADAVARAGLPFAAVTVDNDAVIACLGAHAAGDGGIVISGTGSAGLALVGGRRHAIGGWGFALGDDGSGAMIGRAGLRRAILAHDGLAAPTPLTDALLAAFPGVPAMVDWARSALSRDYGRFAPQVFEAARAGDPHGRAILVEAALALGAMVENLVAAGAPRVALVGSVARALASDLPDTARRHLAEPLADPLDGAILLAGGRVEGLALRGGAPA
ncbi:MAG: BadF/BadG/BcrA/BcrD ATPase family protein [Alsobacter sp.]